MLESLKLNISFKLEGEQEANVPRLIKRHVPKYYNMPRSGNMNSVSTKRGKFLGLLRLSKTDFHGFNYFFFLVALKPNVDHGLFILEVFITCNDPSLSLWLLYTSDQLIAETST
jgi:hypothetical protein